MEKRTVLAFVLIFLIYWFSSQYLWKTQPVEEAEIVERQEPTTEVYPTAHERVATQAHEVSEIREFQHRDIETLNDIVLENDKIKISFSNLGAVINQITLKDFYLSDKVTPVTLVPENQSILQVYFANSMRSTGSDIDISDTNQVPFTHEISDLGDSQTIIFSLNDDDDPASFFKKVYTLHDDYRLDFHIEGKNLSPFDEYTVLLNSGINITEDNKAAVKDIKNSFKFIAQVDRETKNVPLGRLSRGEQRFVGTVNWAAVRSKYFAMTLVPENRIMTQSVRTQRVADTLGFDMVVRYNTRITDFIDRYELYLGPVDYDVLLSFGNGMEHIAELGAKWLRPLATIFMFYISFLHRFINNYGVVIIFFALTLKILLTPLTNKALSSSRKMQKLQPMLREIQNKYKNDVKKQQEELRNLYKENKVSPLGGCLPLLLQMPIFFALYPILRYSIDFRQANFFGWLTDLSEPDPYWILPILMGIFMFIQQKMMQAKQDTTAMDEKQAAMIQSQKMMMYMMPPFMVFIFSSLPAGLVLYWTIFNIFSIFQQYYLNKKQDL